VGRVADAYPPSAGVPTAPAPRRSDDAIAFAMVRSSNNGAPRASVVGVVPPQPFNV
jgi:hypothetical protein